MELKELQRHILTLATLPQTVDPIISCYLNREPGHPNGRQLLEERVRLLRGGLVAKWRWEFEEALNRIGAYLRQGVPEGVVGLAIFVRAGQQPFFLPLQFHVPLPNWFAVDTAPNIYHLVELKDTYHRYAVLFCTETSVRILGLNVGTIIDDIWKEFPGPRDRASHNWTREQYQNDRRQQTKLFISELIGMLSQFMFAGKYGHLILAGHPRVTSRIRKALPNHVAAKLVDVVPASEYDRPNDVVTATLASFVEQEERESQAVVERLQREIDTHGLAVVGTAATFEALKWGQVYMLVLAKAYDPGTGWMCGACGAAGVVPSPLKICAECLSPEVRELNIKEEIVRMAERTGSRVEVVNHSDPLMRLGGIGCRLRFLGPERYGAVAA
jgi:protein required for attachment to host cells